MLLYYQDLRGKQTDNNNKPCFSIMCCDLLNVVKRVTHVKTQL